MENQKYIENEFEWIKNELCRMRAAMEKLAETTVTDRAFERFVEHLETLDKKCGDIQHRQDRQEADLSLLRRIGTAAIGIVSALITAWLTGILHI